MNISHLCVSTLGSLALLRGISPTQALTPDTVPTNFLQRTQTPPIDARALRDPVTTQTSVQGHSPDFSGLDPKGRRVNFFGDFFETPDAPVGGAHIERRLPGEEIYLQFVADTGSEKQDVRKRVLGAMAHDFSTNKNDAPGAHARFLLGDLVYEYGVTSTDDPALEQRVAIFGGNREHLETFAILGNHDLGKQKHPLPDSCAYLDTSRAHHVTPQSSPLNTQTGVNMPNRYYDVTFRSASNKTLLQVILLDTNVLAKDPEQQAWLAKTLENSTAQHVIIAGHHPLKSIGPEHLDPPPFADWLTALTEKYPVSAMFFGHEHNLQARLCDQLPPQFIVGAGSRIDYPPGAHHNKKTAHAHGNTDSIIAFGEPGFGTLYANATHAEVSLNKAKKSQKIRNLFHETIAALPPRTSDSTLLGAAQPTTPKQQNTHAHKNAKRSTHWFALSATSASILGLLLTAGKKWARQRGFRSYSAEQDTLLPLVQRHTPNYGAVANSYPVTLTV